MKIFHNHKVLDMNQLHTNLGLFRNLQFHDWFLLIDWANRMYWHNVYTLLSAYVRPFPPKHTIVPVINHTARAYLYTCILDLIKFQPILYYLLHCIHNLINTQSNSTEGNMKLTISEIEVQKGQHMNRTHPNYIFMHDVSSLLYDCRGTRSI